ncbi:MAG: hypothetical protein ACRCUT_06450 [Spirochaetota bacterium]
MIKDLSPQFLHLKMNGLSIDGVKTCSTIQKHDSPVKKDQLINKISTLSTIGSLIDTSVIISCFSDKLLVSEALKDSGISDPNAMRHLFRLAGSILR